MSEPINPATKWLDGEISTGKLLQELKVSRPSGDDLVACIWWAMNEKLSQLKSDLEKKRDFAERSLKEAQDENKPDDVLAESSARLAYVTALSQLQLHFGRCIENTKAA